MGLPEQPRTEEIAQAISADLLRIHKESYGAGTQSVRTYLVDDFVLCVFDDIELAPSEQVLIDSGRGEPVLQMRSAFEQAIGASFCAAVERATGRKVVAFISTTHLDPNFSIEIFRLHSHAEGTEEPFPDEPPR